MNDARAAIRVLKPGALTTVQDLGRPGHAHLAVPISGAADRPALIRANRLAGNTDGAAGLEMTLLGARLELLQPAVLALTGTPMPARLDGAPVAHDTRFEARAGQVLELGAARQGVRTYLALRGGLDAVATLGSRATDLLSGLGPSPLAAGDALRVAQDLGTPALPPEAARPIADLPVLRFLPGPRDDWFEPQALDRLCTETWRVSPHSNRVAVRLQGEPLPRRIHRELDSEGLVPGAIQVPPSGEPLVFLHDHPTTGGYPVIGVVLPEALPHLAQARPGSTLRFVREVP